MCMCVSCVNVCVGVRVCVWCVNVCESTYAHHVLNIHLSLQR